jgi:hypothetical protein
MVRRTTDNTAAENQRVQREAVTMDAPAVNASSIQSRMPVVLVHREYETGVAGENRGAPAILAATPATAQRQSEKAADTALGHGSVATTGPDTANAPLASTAHNMPPTTSRRAAIPVVDPRDGAQTPEYLAAVKIAPNPDHSSIPTLPAMGYQNTAHDSIRGRASQTPSLPERVHVNSKQSTETIDRSMPSPAMSQLHRHPSRGGTAAGGHRPAAAPAPDRFVFRQTSEGRMARASSEPSSVPAPPSTLPSATQFPATGASASGTSTMNDVEVRKLADRVYTILVRRLANEKQLRGAGSGI